MVNWISKLPILHHLRGYATRQVAGYNIHYKKLGNGPQTLLLLPGALGSMNTDFPTIINRFDQEKYTIVGWDPPGLGGSRPPDRKWSDKFYEDDADVAIALMTSIEQFPFTCIGWSDGGNVAMIMASQRPDLVQGLVVWGSNSFISDEDRKMIRAVERVDQWSPRMRALFEAELGADYFQKQLTEWVEKYCNYPDGEICRSRLPQIKCPTLIIHGKKDTVAPEFHADIIHSEIKGSKRINYPDGKHNLHMKYAEQFIRDVERFLDEEI